MDDNDEDVNPELVEMFTEIVRAEFKAAEKTEEMVGKYTVGEINAAASVSVENVHESFDSEKRKKRLYLLVAKLGEQIGSESMMRFGMEKLQEKQDES